MHMIAPAAAPVFTIPGATFVGLAAPSRGSKENSVWRVTLEPNSLPHPHRVTREEIFVALSGVARAEIAGVRYELTAGCTLIVPPNTEFSLCNPNAMPFECIAMLPVGGQAVIGNDPPFIPPWAA